MLKPRHTLIFLAGLLVGCGGTPTTTPTAATPHGGTIANLSDGKGFVEIVTSPLKKGDKSQSEFQVYFLGVDRTTPLSPTPSSARLTLMMPEGEETIELKSKDGVYLSPPAESLLKGHELNGYLTLDLGSGPVKVEITGR